MFNKMEKSFEKIETMKKTYLKPETKWLEPFDDEALMQETSLDVNDNDSDEEIEEIDDLLSKPAPSVWED